MVAGPRRRGGRRRADGVPSLLVPEPVGPPLPTPPTAQPLEHHELVRWYGVFDPLTPAGVRELMDGFDRPWWIIGGWSIEAFTCGELGVFGPEEVGP
jgi:hypothetical protein